MITSHMRSSTIPDAAGQTAMVAAASAGQDEVVRILIATGRCDLSKAGIVAGDPLQDQVTPLFAAAAANFPRIVRRLVEAGADLDDGGPQGVCPLAIGSANMEIVNDLTDQGARAHRAGQS